MADGLYRQMANYKCMAMLFLLCDVLPHVCFLSRLFQKESIDLAELHKAVDTTLQLLHPYRSGCLSNGHLASLEVQLNGSLKDYITFPSLSDKEHVEHDIQEPFITKLCENIEHRFPDIELLDAFTIFDPSKLPCSFEEANISNYGGDKIDILSRHFVSLDGQALVMDWTNFRTYMMQCCRNMCMQEVMTRLSTNPTLHQMYPELSKLAQICLVIPVSTADCERGFSAMARVKTKLRNQMKNSTLNHCLRILIEGPPIETFDFEKVLDTWKKHGHRRLIL